ncbi:HRDC domain-containing protein, partial [Pelobium sp.]
LTSHNQSANEINDEKLAGLSTKTHRFTAEISGDFPEFSYPNAFELAFKEGAQVMFVKNDASRDKLYFNGKIGVITKINGEFIHVKCADDVQEIVVGKTLWENYKFELNPETKEIEEKVIGTFFQYPLKLAWAITIHKSQGLTFEKAIIDANSAFAHGQVYVALSRCKSFEGMVLRTPISFNSIKTDGTVSRYTQETEKNEPTQQHLTDSKISFQQNLLHDLFDFRQIKYALFQCKKLAEDNHQVISLGFLELVNQLREQTEIDIYAVADKFKRQMLNHLQENGLPEENLALQERIKKGCTYFNERLENLESKLNRINFDADNKAVKKSVDEALVQLNKEIFVKKSALKLCKEGFETLSYLKAKADAEIDFNQKKAKEATVVASSNKKVSGVVHQDLYHQIKRWRDDLAAENDVPVYQVLPQKVLVELVNKLPSNFEELESIKGMGKVKVKQYGNELLTMIADYCEKQDISRTPFQLFVKTQKEKIDTKKVSLDLFKEGKSVSQIAEIRGFTVSTIETHLSNFLSSGEVNIYDLVDKTKVQTISDYILTRKPTSINETKAALDDSISYGEIRTVMKYLETVE